MTLAATCHCGNVRITVPGPPEFLNECLCTVCYKLGGVWAYYKTDQVTIESPYRGFPRTFAPTSNAPTWLSAGVRTVGA
ncbi:hypothetical protein Sste5346_006421 [Sporothrix stenoceras]|uniref:CENP-V/GFA domain-containing protein n=1 Tax=Sporothrix stenoceras TaxID=5173 RepID=A0ABR3YYW9_9PEZI